MKPFFKIRLCPAALVAASLVPMIPTPGNAQVQDPVYQRAYAPFDTLVKGRQYRAGFPDTKTRRMLVRDFLKMGLVPSEVVLGFTDIHHGDVLATAVDQAVGVRLQPTATTQEKTACRIIAWEALESYAEGYLYAGNKDLLESLRAQFPSFTTASSDADTRPKPVELPKEYLGTQARKLSYAIHYFFEPVRETLQFLSEDPDGVIRARDDDYASTGLYHYTQFDDPDQTGLPKVNANPAYRGFNDTNFTDIPDNTNGQPSQTAGTLYGSSLERWGMATYSLADQLWRTAFSRNVAVNSSGTANDANEKAEFTEMLALGEATLHANIHGQFLATLPLAATLTEGDFEQSKIDQARVSVDQASTLLQRIRAQEKPKATALVTSWTPQAVQQQVANYQSAYNTASAYFDGSTGDPNLKSLVATLNDDQVVEEKNADRRLQMRGTYETQLYNLTGLNPSDFGSLQTAANREAYLAAVDGKFTSLMAAPETSIPPADGSQMTTAALRLKAAMFEVQRSYNQFKAYPERVRVELERNKEVNTEIVFGNLIVAIIDQAIATASIVSVSTNFQGLASGTTVSFSGGALAQSQLTIPRALAQTNQQVNINAANSKATVRGLLIDQLLAYDAILAGKIQSDIAGSELRSLYTQAKRLIEDDINYQEVTGALWYADPTLAFKAEAIEEVYRDAAKNCRNEAYLLARMLEAAWIEKFTNPMRLATGSLQSIAGVTNSDDFYESESVFATANHKHVHAFYNTLAKWNSNLGTASYRGVYDPTLYEVNSFGTPAISLRQDIFHLRDYKLKNGIYTFDAELQKKNIREFRAILRNIADHDPRNSPVFTQLRLDFPLRWGHTRLIDGDNQPRPLVERNPSFWNHRLKRLGFRLTGSSVFPTTGNVASANFEWYGNLERIGRNSVSNFNTPEYLEDPDHPQYQATPNNPVPRTRPPFFGGAIKLAYGNYTVVDNPGQPSGQVSGTTVNMTDVNIPLFCDGIILKIQDGLGLKIEQIDDIEVSMRMEVGPLNVSPSTANTYALPSIP